MRQKQVEKFFRHRRGMALFAEAGLLGEGIGVEPVEQLRPPAGDDLHLREMDMGVDEARQDQMRAVVDFRQAWVAQGGIVADGGDLAGINDDGAVLVIGEGGFGLGGVGVE